MPLYFTLSLSSQPSPTPFILPTPLYPTNRKHEVSVSFIYSLYDWNRVVLNFCGVGCYPMFYKVFLIQKSNHSDVRCFKISAVLAFYYDVQQALCSGRASRGHLPPFVHSSKKTRPRGPHCTSETPPPYPTESHLVPCCSATNFFPREHLYQFQPLPRRTHCNLHMRNNDMHTSV